MDLKEYQTATALRAETGFWQNHKAQIQKLLEKRELKLRTPSKRKNSQEFDDEEFDDEEELYVAKEESLFIPPKPELKLVGDSIPIYSFLFGLGQFSIELYLELVEKKIRELEQLFEKL